MRMSHSWRGPMQLRHLRSRHPLSGLNPEQLQEGQQRTAKMKMAEQRKGLSMEPTMWWALNTITRLSPGLGTTSGLPLGAEEQTRPHPAAAVAEKPFRPRFEIPPDLHNRIPLTDRHHKIIAQTAKFVRAAGHQSEFVLRVKHAHNPNFAFLLPSDPLHAYFQWLVKDDPQETLSPPPEEGEGEGEDEGRQQSNAVDEQRPMPVSSSGSGLGALGLLSMYDSSDLSSNNSREDLALAATDADAPVSAVPGSPVAGTGGGYLGTEPPSAAEQARRCSSSPPTGAPMLGGTPHDNGAVEGSTPVESNAEIFPSALFYLPRPAEVQPGPVWDADDAEGADASLRGDARGLHGVVPIPTAPDDAVFSGGDAQRTLETPLEAPAGRASLFPIGGPSPAGGGTKATSLFPIASTTTANAVALFPVASASSGAPGSAFPAARSAASLFPVAVQATGSGGTDAASAPAASTASGAGPFFGARSFPAFPLPSEEGLGPPASALSGGTQGVPGTAETTRGTDAAEGAVATESEPDAFSPAGERNGISHPHPSAGGDAAGGSGAGTTAGSAGAGAALVNEAEEAMEQGGSGRVAAREPPRDTQAIIEKLVAFVKKAGPKFELAVMQKESKNKRFAFLHPNHKFHPFYRDNLESALGKEGMEEVFRLRPAQPSASLQDQPPTSLAEQPSASLPKQPLSSPAEYPEASLPGAFPAQIPGQVAPPAQAHGPPAVPAALDGLVPALGSEVPSQAEPLGAPSGSAALSAQPSGELPKQEADEEEEEEPEEVAAEVRPEPEMTQEPGEAAARVERRGSPGVPTGTGDRRGDDRARYVAEEVDQSSESPEGSPPGARARTLPETQTRGRGPQGTRGFWEEEEEEGLPWAGEGSESPVAVECAVQGGTNQSTAGHDPRQDEVATAGGAAIDEEGIAGEEPGRGVEEEWEEEGEVGGDGEAETEVPAEVPYSRTWRSGSGGARPPAGSGNPEDEQAGAETDDAAWPGVLPDQATDGGESQAGRGGRLPLLQLKLTSGAGRGRVLAQNALEQVPKSGGESAGPKPAGAPQAGAASAAAAAALSGGTGARAPPPSGGTPLLVKANRSVLAVPKARSAEAPAQKSSSATTSGSTSDDEEEGLDLLEGGAGQERRGKAGKGGREKHEQTKKAAPPPEEDEAVKAERRRRARELLLRRTLASEVRAPQAGATSAASKAGGTAAMPRVALLRKALLAEEEENWEVGTLHEPEPGEVVPEVPKVAPTVPLPPTSAPVLPSLEDVMRARAGIRVATARELSPLSSSSSGASDDSRGARKERVKPKKRQKQGKEKGPRRQRESSPRRARDVQRRSRVASRSPGRERKSRKRDRSYSLSPDSPMHRSRQRETNRKDRHGARSPGRRRDRSESWSPVRGTDRKDKRGRHRSGTRSRSPDGPKQKKMKKDVRSYSEEEKHKKKKTKDHKGEKRKPARDPSPAAPSQRPPAAPRAPVVKPDEVSDSLRSKIRAMLSSV
eukprot:jgi/Botrbrau1/8562/Bobra.0359s0026.1